MNEEIYEYISQTADSIDKIIQLMKIREEKTREQEIALQKLEEAVFWLTYGLEDYEAENESI